MSQYISVKKDNVLMSLTEAEFASYQNNPNYQIIMENGVYKILTKMHG